MTRLVVLLADSDPTIRQAQGDIVKGAATNYAGLAVLVVIVGLIVLLADRL